MSRGTVLITDAVSLRTAVLSTLDPKMIARMPREQLVELQKRLGYGDTWRSWEVPEAWAPATHGSPGARTVRLKDDTQHGDLAWTELLRFALVRSLVRGAKYGVPKPITVRNELRTAVQLVPIFVSKPAADASWWSRVSEDELIRLKKTRGDTLAKSVAYLHRQGYVRDCPSPRAVDGTKERNRKGEAAPTNSVQESKQWQPLPDEFTGQCGQRVLWVVKMLGPTLLDVFKVASHAASAISMEGKAEKYRSNKQNEARQNVVKNWNWRAPDGSPIEAAPFVLHIKRKVLHAARASATSRRTYETFSWPARTWGEITQLIALLQACHAWILMLASGPRASTVLSYEEDCLEAVPGGYRLKAMLYKTSDHFGGRLRDWPAPPIVVDTVKQQVRLARLLKQTAPDAVAARGTHLWVQTHRTHQCKGGVGARMRDINDVLESLVRRFGLHHLLDKDNPRLHSHRFRKTLARIVALTLTNAQMILMDCFGHDDPEMTLRRYILSDPAILSDVKRVQRELVVLMARDAIEHSDDLGGRMGAHVRDAKARYMRVHRKSELDPKDAYELAESLTMQGRDWVVIMPGVICTLPLGFTGPCAARQGGRNPGNCQSGCDHQLLTAYNKAECDDMVHYIIEQLQLAVDEDAELMISLWVGQLLNWLYRWSAVYDKWARHPLVIKYGDAKSMHDLVLA